MNRPIVKIAFVVGCLLAAVSLSAAQPNTPSGIRGQERDDDGVPVLVKHLPDWEEVRGRAVFAVNSTELKKAAGDRKVLDLIDFAGGTEAVVADYPAGRLVIVEFPTPQASVDADARITQTLAVSPEPATAYRRIGNYNAFVFNTLSGEEAATLLDQVKYEKSVQWLGEDPFLLKKLERYFVSTARDIFISTVLWIVGGLGISVLLGIIVGVVFYRIREQKRATWTAFSDAGGLTRLNLDGMSER